MYRPLCCTKYNPDYYSRDKIKWGTADHNAENTADYNSEYNDDYNTEYNAISVSKLHYREYNVQ